MKKKKCPAPRPILLVDDDPNIVDGLRDILEDAGYPVRAASTCARALEALEAPVPFAALIDFQLPDGTGSELARQIRERFPAMRLFLLTGMAGSDLANVRPDAVDEVLTKPVPVPELLARLAGAAT
jgi:CheY-like chemotaxis protein